ncbi:MAG: D-glycero-beta-D-manno-heptose-7-phosphate kinase [Vicinamibacterales bacterium]
MTLPALRPARARDLIASFRGLPVLVVGDVMLDRFIVGDVTRISPEAPVPVVRFRSEHVRLGGAANVVQNLAAFGARVSLIGLVGADAAAARVRELLDACGVSGEGLVEDRSRPTVEKVRIVTGRNQQVARIDYEEDTDATGDVEARIVKAVLDAAPHASILLASDYLKGTLTRATMRALVAAKTNSRRLLVDPKIPHLEHYAGASLVTPNHLEAEIATHQRIRTDDDARLAAVAFRERARCDAALITRGEHGLWLSSPDMEGAVPAVAREVSDVTGAGDTVVATLALVLAAGGTLAEAAVLANQAAGIVVGKFGPATVTPAELAAAF